VIPLKRILPSPSYSIAVPEAVREERDERVTSLWLEGEALLLQLSSYLRTEGKQVTAHDRLHERIQKHPARWTMRPTGLHPDSSIDQAAAESFDEEGRLWLHSYLVWPHLTVHALISGPASEVRNADSWTAVAVTSIELAVH
jgi:hypothetical protein